MPLQEALNVIAVESLTAVESELSADRLRAAQASEADKAARRGLLGTLQTEDRPGSRTRIPAKPSLA